MGRLIHLSSLPSHEANAILDRVVALDARIFHHSSEGVQERYHKGMRDLSVGEKSVVLYEEAGELVGYNLIKIQPFEVEGRTTWVVGSVAGFLPGHTGGNRTMEDAIRAMLRHKLRHPGRDFFFVSFLINPGGYDMLVDLCPTTFPSVHTPAPSGFELSLIAAAAQRAGFEILVHEKTRLVVMAGRSAREPFERRRDTENIRFFEKMNPRYAEGELLGVCVPLGFEQLITGALRLGRRRLRRSRTARAA